MFRRLLPVVVVLFLLYLETYGDFPQLHRALPGANGKPGYRVTSHAAYAKVNNEGVEEDKSNINHGQNKQRRAAASRRDNDNTRVYQPQNTMDSKDQWSQAAFYSLISCTLVGLSGVFPLIIIPLEAGPSLKHGAGSVMLKLLLSFAVGSLLGDVFLHLLPEAWATVHNAEDPHWAHTVVGLWVIAGVLSFLTLEKVFGEAEDEEETEEEAEDLPLTSEPVPQHGDSLRKRANGTAANGTMANGKAANGAVANGKAANGAVANGKAANGAVANGKAANGAVANGTATHSVANQPPAAKETSIHITGYLNLLANCIDNFTHGLAVAGSYLISPKVGLCTTIAILLHEVPHEIGDFAILLRSGFDRWKAAKAQVLTASGGLLGALTALMCDSAEEAGDKTAAILPFTAGGFIYIALATVVPELLKETSVKESFKQMACIILGVVSMMLVTVLFEG